MISTIRHISFLLFLALWLHSNASANVPPNNLEFQLIAETDLFWQLKKMAPVIEKELSANFKVGLNCSEKGGNLIFSYHKKF